MADVWWHKQWQQWMGVTPDPDSAILWGADLALTVSDDPRGETTLSLDANGAYRSSTILSAPPPSFRTYEGNDERAHPSDLWEEQDKSPLHWWNGRMNFRYHPRSDQFFQLQLGYDRTGRIVFIIAPKPIKVCNWDEIEKWAREQMRTVWA